MTCDCPLPLEGGGTLPGFEISYETYGTLSPWRDNAILVCHSLTQDAHAAGQAGPDQRRGWWNTVIGPGRILDTTKYFVICSDALAAGRSTGPASIDPETGRPYGARLPVVTVADMVAAQAKLIEFLGIETLCAVIGGCMGGQQAIQWAISHPSAVRNAIVITTTPATSAHSIAIFSVMRHLIRDDPAWNGGDYYDGVPPLRGLGNAVAAGVPLWMSREALEARCGRRVVTGNGVYAYSLDPEFAVERLIEDIAGSARSTLDANGLMYLMRAVEYFDLERTFGSLGDALAPVTASVLLISYRKDWRYPAAETQRMCDALRAAGAVVRHAVLDSPMGHGAFLYDPASLGREVRAFLTADELSRGVRC